MASQKPAVFKYRHDSVHVTATDILWRFTLYLAVVALLVYFVEPVGYFMMFVGAIVLIVTWPKKRLSLGTRYLLCGNTVVYYGAVRKIVLRPDHDLELHWDKDSVFTLEAKRFTSKARHENRVAQAKAAKFTKVSTGIIRRVLQAVPDVKCVGVDLKKLKLAP